jgi:7-cyano-7-deazaguanine synthase
MLRKTTSKSSDWRRKLKPKSVALLSGGLDSCVALACAYEDSDPICAVSFDYGQKHVKELSSAEAITDHYKLRHYLINLSTVGDVLADLHATALVDPDEALPSKRRMSEMTARVPRSYVPGRNTMMLAITQSIAEGLNADEIYCGFNAVDFSGYPDCRPIFVEAWNHVARYSTKRGYENNPIILRAPIINLAKASVVRRGVDLRAPLGLTWSCYNGGPRPCGVCDSCIIRWNAFQENGLDDPIGGYNVVPHRSVL